LTGGRIFHFPIYIGMGLTTVQRYCAACDLAQFSSQTQTQNMTITGQWNKSHFLPSSDSIISESVFELRITSCYKRIWNYNYI